MERLLLSAQNIKELFGISRNTLLLWETKGLLHPIRTPGGQRRYRRDEIERLLSCGEVEPPKQDKITILYARVSTKKQEKYLLNQIERLKEFAKKKGWKYEIISEIASGVNENRRGLRKLLTKVKNGEVERVIIEYSDRLARFGFEYLKFFLETFGVELVVINGEEEEEYAGKELAEDLVAIVTSFAARIYGKRGGRK